jgi:hypothetical protein
MEAGNPYRRRQLCGILQRAEKLLGLLALRILDLPVIKESHGRAPPNDPVSVVLMDVLSAFPSSSNMYGGGRTSFFVTGLSTRTRCVSPANLASTSKSESSDRLFDASTRFRRYGVAFGRLGWIVEILFRARRRVRMRGESGKFPSTCMSLSVRSIASCGYRPRQQRPGSNAKHGAVFCGARNKTAKTYSCHAKVLDGLNSVACSFSKEEIDSISILPLVKV